MRDKGGHKGGAKEERDKNHNDDDDDDDEDKGNVASIKAATTAIRAHKNIIKQVING